MTPSELKRNVERTGSVFFSRETMRFFGDTMRNYRVTGPVDVETWGGPGLVERVTCWRLERKKAVKHGQCSDAFFHWQTFERIHPKVKP